MNIPEGLVCHPAVFAVEDTYQILILAKTSLLVSVLINGKEYASHISGVRCSETPTHRITVPQAVLNEAGAYQLRIWISVNRLSYWPVLEEPKEYAYPFHPLTKTDGICLYHIADAHGHFKTAVTTVTAAATPPDVLLFNGDLPNQSDNYQDMHTMLLIASEVAQGTLPCVCARGNHDLRGQYAEDYIRYIPHHHGLTYYTFRLGCLWGVVLDCGEDKPDTHEAYGINGSVLCCHDFRLEETEFLRHVAGYAAPGIRYRLVLSHAPFTRNLYNMEVPIYTEWSKLLRERIKPHVMLCGHTHECAVYEEGGPFDNHGQPCPVIISNKPRTINDEENGYTGASIVLRGNTAEVTCNDNTGAIGMQRTVLLKDWQV